MIASFSPVPAVQRGEPKLANRCLHLDVGGCFAHGFIGFSDEADLDLVGLAKGLRF